MSSFEMTLDHQRLGGSFNSSGFSFWTILPFKNPFGCTKIAIKYQTSHADPPDPSNQLWSSGDFPTISQYSKNLLLPKLLPKTLVGNRKPCNIVIYWGDLT